MSPVEDFVASVTPAGTEINYDLWVPGHENFIAEGVVHHNSGKSMFGASEFASWIIGYRPWDGSLTCRDKEPGVWLVAAPTHATHFPDTILPYLETRIGHMVVKRERDSNGQVRRWLLSNADEVQFISFEQVLKAGRRAAATEGARYKGAWIDEPPPRRMLRGVMRGLMRRQAAGWGRLLITGTSIDDEYLFNMVYLRSWNKGGDKRNFFSTEFDFTHNPSLTEEEKKNLEAVTSPDERAMALHGRFRALSGRLYPQYSREDNSYSRVEFDPLVDIADQDKPEGQQSPSDWPVVMCIDPHDARPPAITWTAISPLQEYFVVAEWPTGNYEDLRTYSGGFDDLAREIRDIEAEFPGGSQRVVHRYMDPIFGPASKMGMGDKTVQEALAAQGIHCSCDFSADLTLRHGKMRDLLKIPNKKQPRTVMNRPKLFIADHLRNCHWSLSNYTRKADVDPDKAPSGQVGDAGKDFCDSLGFLAVMQPRHRSWFGDGMMKGASVDEGRWEHDRDAWRRSGGR